RSVTAEEVTEMGTRLTRVTIDLADSSTLQASAEANAVNIPLPAAAVAEARHEEPLPVVTVASTAAEPPAPHVEPVPEPVKSEPDPVTRVGFDLAHAADYHVVKVGDRLQVSFGEAAKIAALDAPSVAAGFSRPTPSAPAEAGAYTEPKPAPTVEAVPIVAENA